LTSAGKGESSKPGQVDNFEGMDISGLIHIVSHGFSLLSDHRSPEPRGARMRHNYLFTSESVTEGHPDKIADQISDGILDAIIAQDKYARVACEMILTTGIAFVAGEISTKAY